MKTLPVTLEPDKDVLCEEMHFHALSPEPWLKIVPQHPFKSQEIIEISYRSSFWDDSARPIFRFWNDENSFREVLGTAPIAGSASITLRIPENTKKLSVSPANALGRFDFEVESVKIYSRFEVFKRCLTEGTSQAQLRIFKHLLTFKSPSLFELDWGLGLTGVKNFPIWLKRYLRDVDLKRCDAPRCDWSQVPEIQLFLRLEADNFELCINTIKSLQTQVFNRWRLNILTNTGVTLPPDARVRLTNLEDFVNLSRGLAPEALVSSLVPGDELYPYTLALTVEAQARHPSALLFYGDECIENAGLPAHPVIKPGWSPLLASESAYLGRGVFARGAQLESVKTEWIETGRLNQSTLIGLQADQVHPLRRFVLKTRRLNEVLAVAPPPPFASTEINPSAMIIIPTRDQTDLLGRCVRSIFERTTFQNFSIIIVDNDSVELASKKFFKAFFGDKIVSVSHSPGAFNFSALCNAGASRRRPDVLVFLKNYVEIVSEDWLTRLVAHALLPETGAVGPIGLYHGRKLPKPLVGFMPFERTAHEILAVSTDCLAVGRRKFLLTGGFDAANFPTALPNLDFCLRLKEKGFINRVDPAIGISTTDAPKLLPSFDETNRFKERWGSIERDDPYFHPGLSLFFAQESSLNR